MNKGLIEGFGGGNKKKTPTILTLNSTTTLEGDNLIIYGNMTLSDQNIKLPDATSCQNGCWVLIENSGVNQFCVRDYNGKFLFALNPNQVVSVILTDSSSSSGVWIVENKTSNTDLIEFYQNTMTTVNSTSTTGIDVVQLTATTYLATYIEGAATKAVVLTINSDNTVTAGTVATVAATGNSADYISCAKISATQVVVHYGTGASIYAVVLSISGTTITVNASVTVATGGTNYAVDVCVLTSTLILVLYNINGTNTYARTLSLSGTTLTVNTNQTAISTYANFVAVRNNLVPISSTSATLTGEGYGFILHTISTTAITVASADFKVSYSASDKDSALLTTNTIISVTGQGSTPYQDYLSVATISGSTVSSVMFSVDDSSYSLNAYQHTLTVLNPSKVIYGKWVTSAICLFSINTSDKDVKRTAKPYVLKQGYGTPLAMANDGVNKVLLLCLNNGTNYYLTASVIEVSA